MTCVLPTRACVRERACVCARALARERSEVLLALLLQTSPL